MRQTDARHVIACVVIAHPSLPMRRLADHHRKLAGVTCHRDPACGAADGCTAIGLSVTAHCRRIASTHDPHVSVTRIASIIVPFSDGHAAGHRASAPTERIVDLTCRRIRHRPDHRCRCERVEAHHLLTLSTDHYRAHLVPYVAQGLSRSARTRLRPYLLAPRDSSDRASARIMSSSTTITALRGEMKVAPRDTGGLKRRDGLFCAKGFLVWARWNETDQTTITAWRF